MRLGRKALATLAAPAALAAVATPAHAAEPTYRPPEVQWVHTVHATADSATLRARYRCYGGNEGTHLWVSLKQGGGIQGDAMALAMQEGTSAIAASWYDSHPDQVVCNGRFNTLTYTVNREHGIPGYHPDDWAPLQKGPAFLQFCLFDSTAAEAGPDNTDQGFGYLYTWVQVHTR
ncbi:hypothetical protein EV189_1370 [Motilibacter rhizosphaerae]|uniref:Uncharacterized protein n=1 Tax=Motilibacter rhizosphaerae TaxID=598652 RepID=A0A4Q7NT90_9ACTN|nr:hypothetical protein [Motilibacter rhizosphaerae]RZS89602.1 hypothetical protein EV189_1370 [Motilibacter rhizosphaerae]